MVYHQGVGDEEIGSKCMPDLPGGKRSRKSNARTRAINTITTIVITVRRMASSLLFASLSMWCTLIYLMITKSVCILSQARVSR